MSDRPVSRSFLSRDPNRNDDLATEVNPARRLFFKGVGNAGLTATAALLFGDLPVLLNAQSTAANQDTVTQILTAALIAEDLATTFYYNGLVGPVIQDPSLAGPDGTATAPTSTGQSLGNLSYIRAALNQEIEHATLLRAIANRQNGPAADPYLTFYFPANTFSSLATFISTLESLENAFIGAYLNAIREFSTLAARSAVRNVPQGQYGSTDYSAAQYSYFAMVAASILGVECEHRALGRVIVHMPPTSNNLYYEQTDGLTSVYHGSGSAVAALTPFLTASTGTGYSLQAAIAGAATVGLASSPSNPPSQ